MNDQLKPVMPCGEFVPGSMESIWSSLFQVKNVFSLSCNFFPFSFQKGGIPSVNVSRFCTRFPREIFVKIKAVCYYRAHKGKIYVQGCR